MIFHRQSPPGTSSRCKESCRLMPFGRVAASVTPCGLTSSPQRVKRLRSAVLFIRPAIPASRLGRPWCVVGDSVRVFEHGQRLLLVQHPSRRRIRGSKRESSRINRQLTRIGASRPGLFRSSVSCISAVSSVPPSSLLRLRRQTSSAAERSGRFAPSACYVVSGL